MTLQTKTYRRFWGRVFALVAICCSVIPAAHANAREIIFIPSSPGRTTHRLADWVRLFEPDAAWHTAASHVNTFGFDAGFLETASDADIVRAASDLRHRNIAIAISIPALAYMSSADCGHGVEGYHYPAEGAVVAKKLKRLGITPSYLGMDEPLWFGRFDKDQHACQGSVGDIARRAALNVREYLNEFPNLQIWEGEPVPGITLQARWQTEYETFRHTFETIVGRPIVALDLDVNWRSPDWPDRVIEVGDFAHKLGMKLGVIYNGDGSDTTDAAWIAHAVRNYTRLESEFQPDRAVFAGWNDHPTHVLPETSDGSMTHLINEYFLPTPTLVVERAGIGLAGRLTDASQQPVQAARLFIESEHVSRALDSAEIKAAGTVPPNAVKAILGLRVNVECNCVGKNDFLLGDITYREGNAQHSSPTAELPAREIVKRGALNGRVRLDINNPNPLVHVQVNAEQTFMVNSDPFNVNPGASFALSSSIDVLAGKGLFGGIVLIWLDRDGHGLARVAVGKADKYIDVSSVMTDAAGQFSVSGEKLRGSQPAHIRLRFAGSGTLRPVIKVVPW